MVTASSWNYYKGKSNPAILFSVTPLQYWHGDHCVFDRPCNAIGRMGAMSLPTYALAGFSKRDPISNEAAIKYFMFGALSSAIIVLAIGLVYGITEQPT